MKETMKDLIRRDILDNLLNMTLKDGVNMESGADKNLTNSIINSLFLVQVQQERYMHIALGAVSMTLALWVIFRIWYDSWRASQIQVKLRPRKFGFLTDLHPAESFPLVLAFTSFAQALIFVVIQALALNSILVSNCVMTAQIIFPAIFALGYMHLVYGFEMTVRSLKRNPFQPRGKWTNIACIVVFFLLVAGTWVPTRIWPDTMKCYGDIIWRPFRNVKMGAIISGSLIFAFLTMAAIVGIQLYHTRDMDPNERIAGSRMVYYLAGSAILQVLLIPFFIQGVTMTFDAQVSSSRIAEFILFTAGSFLALLHLILRANASLTAIKPKSAPWHRKRRFRLFGPSDLELITISAPLDLIHDSYRPDEKSQDIYAPKIISPPPALSTFNFQPTTSEILSPRWPLPEERLPSPKPGPKSPNTPPATSPGTSHKRNKPSYSIFPTSEADEIIQLPATTYSPPSSSAPVRRQNQPESELKPSITIHSSASVTDVSEASFHADDMLPPRHPWADSFHRRGSSAVTSATVQIGIRLSNAAAVLGHGNALASIIEASPDLGKRPESGLRRSLSLQQERRKSESPPSPISKERLKESAANQDSRSKDSRQKPELRRLETAPSLPGEAITLQPVALTSPKSKAQRTYEPPNLAPSKDDRLDGFF